jgi:hypothetical protein
MACRLVFLYFTALAFAISACYPNRTSPTAVQSESLSTSPVRAFPEPDATDTGLANEFSEQVTEVANTTGLPSATVQVSISTEDIIFQILEQVDLERVVKDLNQLTGEEPLCLAGDCHTIDGRETGSEGLRWAKRYIYEELVNMGYLVEYQSWSRANYSDHNIIVRKPGTVHREEEIYFVAHLDGVRPALLSKRPAADDNASGVVDLLELARVLRSYSFERTLVLFFSTGEEQGTLGVKSYLAQRTPEELNSIKYVINIDMIGYDANHDPIMELWHGGHSPSLDFAELFSNVIKHDHLNLIPRLVVGCG